MLAEFIRDAFESGEEGGGAEYSDVNLIGSTALADEREELWPLLPRRLDRCGSSNSPRARMPHDFRLFSNILQIGHDLVSSRLGCVNPRLAALLREVNVRYSDANGRRWYISVLERLQELSSSGISIRLTG